MYGSLNKTRALIFGSRRIVWQVFNISVLVLGSKFAGHVFYPKQTGKNPNINKTFPRTSLYIVLKLKCLRLVNARMLVTTWLPLTPCLLRFSLGN